MIRFSLVLLIASVIFVFRGFSQNGYTVTITGETSVNTSTTYTYNVVWKYMGSPASPPVGGTYNWTVYGGTAYSSGSTYAAIGWTSGGTAIFEYNAGGSYYYATINVSTSNCASVAAVTFSLSSNTCSPRALSYTGTPPSGVTWYWQTSPLGTSKANPGSEYSVNSPGTYYVRGFNSASNCWGSDAASYYVSTVTPSPVTPSTPFVISAEPCGSQALSFDPPPSGVTYYWQGHYSNGTSTENSGVYLAFDSGPYFLRARSNATGCWSPEGSTYIYVTVNDPPPAPPVPTVNANTCGSRTLSKTGSPPGGVSWYWQGTNSSGSDYTSSGATGTTFTADASGYYYLRAKSSNGCWSASTAVYVTVNEVPSIPPTPSVSANICGPKTITRGTPPSGVTWYWQGTNPDGTSTESSSSTFTANSDGTYYLRARQNSGGCWSNSTSVVVAVSPIPPTPLEPIGSENCGPVTLSRAQSSENGTWYWQGTNANGTDHTSGTATNPTFIATSTGTYYLRAFVSNSNGGCWSSPAGVSITYNPLPATPSTPYVISNDPCGSKALSFDSPPSGVSYYWQGSNANGTSTQNSGTQLAFSTGTYYLRANNNSTGCWSASASSIFVTVDNGPPAPPTPALSSNNCGPKTLSKSGTPPIGEGWYWQGTSISGTDYTSTTATTATFIANTSSTYYIRSRSGNGCWGSATPVVVSVNEVPTNPPTPTASGDLCYTKTVSKNGTQPSGITWYWQTGPNGTDYTSGLATAPTLSLSSHGTTTVYLRARNNATGCWSTGLASLPVTVNNPGPPNSNSIEYCEIESMPLTTTGYSTNLKWYSSSDEFLWKGTTYTPVDVNMGSYTYKVKNLNGVCESTESADVTLIVKADCDELLNWVEEVFFTIDASGNSVPYTATRAYVNGLGRTMQTQIKSYSTNQVLAVSHIADYLGATVLTTLPAPINRSEFSYRARFVTNNTGQNYEASHFDLLPSTGGLGEVENPQPIGNNGVGTLGWYYSTANITEPLTPTTDFPYVRSWSEVGPDPKISKIAAPGEQHKMGSGHEQKVTRDLWQPSDLSHYYSIRTYFVTVSSANTALPGYKQTYTDPDGKKQVVFSDAAGRVLASGVVVSENPVEYDYWSYSFYNDVGQLIAEVAPEGINTNSNAYPSFVTIYSYDHLGRLIQTASPDEGSTQFVYSLDGKLRFSQNEEQRNATPKRFSYTNYDRLGRLVESGEYTESAGAGIKYTFQPHTTAIPSQYSVLNIADNNILDLFNITAQSYTGVSHKLDAARCGEYTFIYYDVADPGYVPYLSYASQENLRGRVSKTENTNAASWYSYDEMGRLAWSVQEILGADKKSVEYAYDFLGNVTTVIYQKDTPADRFYHHYLYDKENRLTEVRTSKDGVNKMLHAQYEYYLHGPAKRVVLGNDLQGIDYTYTINGSLKTINHADPARDPGGDGANDVFGETLHYFDNDYTGAGYDAGTQTVSGTSNLYGGYLKAVAWHSPAGNHQMQAYMFEYNDQNFLTNAQWGNVTGSSTYGFTPSLQYQESASAYDKNGNIGTMLRRGKDEAIIANYDYVYEPGTNMLDRIDENSAVFVDYEYNAIGQMIRQDEANTLKIGYNAYGLVKEIKDGDDHLVQAYRYDDRGNLLQKVLYDSSGNPIQHTTYFSDVAGNVLAIYLHETAPLPAQATEVPVYGTGRLAVYKPGVNQYFYEISDHLGNVRAVIGAPATITTNSNFESLTNTEFDNYSRHRDDLADHTDTGTTYEYSQLVNGGYAGQIGLAKSLEVSPGDELTVEAYANYRNVTTGGVNFNGFAAALTAAFGLASGGTGEFAGAFEALDDYGVLIASGFDHSQNQTAPKAYLNILVFDRNYELVDAAYRQVTTDAYQANSLAKGPHEHLMVDVTIDEPGYAYVFLSNENPDQVDVYFDDVAVMHTQSPIVNGSDYYPFGLVMDGREIEDEPYRWGYQGQFSEKDLATGMQEFELRMYDPRIGRWLSPDPYGQFASPYLAMGNMPHIAMDPTGGVCPPPCTVWDDVLQAFVFQEAVTVSANAISLSAIPIVASVVGYNMAGGPIFKGADDGLYSMAPSMTGNRYYQAIDGQWQFIADEGLITEQYARDLSATHDLIAETTVTAVATAMSLAPASFLQRAAARPVLGNVNVYVSTTTEGVVQYAGITNNLARRAAQHLAKKGINIEPLMQNLSAADARAVEQALIEIHGLAKNGGTLMNQINSIAKTNPAYASQLQRGFDLLKSIGY